jgi:hypothetical protein
MYVECSALAGTNVDTVFGLACQVALSKQAKSGGFFSRRKN